MFGKMSVAVLSMAYAPIRTIRTANMMNVYGRCSATLTIHMMCSDRLPRDCRATPQTTLRPWGADASGSEQNRAVGFELQGDGCKVAALLAKRRKNRMRGAEHMTLAIRGIYPKLKI